VTIVCVGESVRWGERLRAADGADRVARGYSGLGDMRAGGRKKVGMAIHRRVNAKTYAVGGDQSDYDEDDAIVMMGSYGPAPPRCVSVVSNHM
jgi:hypothetical protein